MSWSGRISGFFVIFIFSSGVSGHPGARHHHAAPAPSNPFSRSGRVSNIAVPSSRPMATATAKWFSSDMHIHATGCRPEANPTSSTASLKDQLKRANTNIGDLLIWGDQQSYLVDAPNFRGQQDDPASDAQTILHWDLEISLLPGHLFGHQTFLNLADLNLFRYPSSTDAVPYPNYPGKDYLLPNFTWAQKQGAVVGYPHAEDWTAEVYSPRGLTSSIAPRELPMDVVKTQVDFIATEYVNDANYLWLWYSMLNNGFHLAPAAGSDYPCFEGAVGRVQTMFALPQGSALNFGAYIAAIKSGRTVIKRNVNQAASTGEAPASARTDYLDMRVDGQPLGSELSFASSKKTVTVEVDAAGGGNNQLGIVVNGIIVATAPLTATPTTFTFQVPFEKSGWVAAITMDAHTAATYVLVNGCDIRLDPAGASKWAEYVRSLSDFLPPRGEILVDIALASLAWQRIAQEGFSDQCVARRARR